ncbi:GTP:AMP phosphotransferase AK3, mitochondrial [Coccinella septempunctata]|uniref:GTP:AMP phosphotransferase AK3, mitochondrial n=1 Tax=Coccinella septempunctata TaxID=41139 RepID=UPI001D073700|nr:GTP:AMP phosphotransferase AK3, mitochondrial [Coccinella septempunctata]
MAFRSVILGAPASGKGTISSRIVKTFGLEHVASGDRLRINITKNTPIGKTAKKYIEEGLLVPDDLMVNFISEEIRQIKKNIWLLDGFPRTVSQAESLWRVQKLDVVLNLVVPYNIIVDRVKGRWIHLPSGRVYNTDFNAPKVPGKDDITGEDLVQRKDDSPEIVLKRLEQYEKMTRPVINFYKEKGILEEFAGNTSDEIWPKVKSVLLNYLSEVK